MLEVLLQCFRITSVAFRGNSCPLKMWVWDLRRERVMQSCTRFPDWIAVKMSAQRRVLCFKRKTNNQAKIKEIRS